MRSIWAVTANTHKNIYCKWSDRTLLHIMWKHTIILTIFHVFYQIDAKPYLQSSHEHTRFTAVLHESLRLESTRMSGPSRLWPHYHSLVPYQLRVAPVLTLWERLVALPSAVIVSHCLPAFTDRLSSIESLADCVGKG